MKDKDSIFGAEPERLRDLIRSGMDVDDDDYQEKPAVNDKVGKIMERPGASIGCYKLLRVLGEGGMGMVYLAEQEQLIRRRVALKIIKPGMDSKRVLARFETERQALALLDHPNIAHVYDAGTSDSGRPYFVMEFVKGMPITEYCDRHSLNINQRLRLFQQVCSALQHAHQKGIIHRDIKPSNILVTSENDQPIPKIIDFGVAKAVSQPLTERTLITEENQLLGTPEYMSPEQVEQANEDIDTRSDIYSLGVLLYELLTGVLPFDSKTFRQGGVEQIRKIISETDPKTPSTRLTKLGDEAKKVAQSRRTEVAALARCLHKELEWIPLKAMRKERSERYRSASELADDIENYLKGEPLIAGPLSTSYRVRKFMRRHKALVTGVAAVLVVLLAGIFVSMIFAIKASIERDNAERAEKVAEERRIAAVLAYKDANEARVEAVLAQKAEKEQKEIAQNERNQAEKAKLLAEEETEKARKAQDLAERSAYKGTVQAALAKIESEKYTGLRELLFGTEIGRRGWEWGYLVNNCQIPDWEFQSGEPIRSICVNSDGKQIVTGHIGALSIWDSDTFQCLRRFGNIYQTEICHYDPQGQFIAVLLKNPNPKIGPIVKLDINSETRIRTPNTSNYNTFCISPDGEYIYAGTNNGEIHRLRSIDLTINESESISKQLDPIISLNIDESGKLLGIVCETGKLYLYKASTLELIAEKGQLPEKDGDNHKQILISSSLNKMLVLSLKHGSIFTNTLDPNNNDLRNWPLIGGRSMALNKDHTRLAVAEWEGNIHVIDTQNMQKLYTFYHNEQIWDVSYLPNGTIITGGESGILKCWSRFGILNETPKKLIEFPHDTVAWNLDYRSDGHVIAFNVWNYNGLFLYDTEKKEYEELIVEGIEKDLANYGRPVTLFRPGSTQLIVEADNSLHVYDTGNSGNPEIYQIHPSYPVLHAAFSPNGKYMALSYENGTIGLIDFEKGMSSEKIFQVPGQQNSFVSISVNGVLAALEKGSMEKGPGERIFLWDIYTGNLLRTMDTYPSRFFWEYWEIQGITFDPSGRYLSFGNLNGIIEIWDTHTGKKFKELKGHLSNLVSSVQFSQDGSRLLSAGRDETIRVWDWALGQELIALQMGYRLSDAQFSPNELYICTTGYETSTGCTIQAASWRLNPRQP